MKGSSLCPTKSLYVLLALLLLVGCRATGDVVPTPVTTTASPTSPTAVPSPSSTSAPPTATVPPPEHRIGVRVVDGVGEFYDRVTGERFVPRGANYIRLDWQRNRAGDRFLGHSTFGPGFYDAERAEQALAQMQADGYNVARVFLETGTTTSIDGTYGLSDAYMDNVADFLRLAQAHDIYVIFATDWVPDAPPYSEIIARECCEIFNSSNAVHLSASGVEANRLFFADVARALLDRQAPLEAVFSFNVSNELSFDSDQPPLSWTSGTVTPGNGQTYDMANPADKRRMIDDGVVYFIDQVRAAIREVSPTALVGVGFFEPQEPNPSRVGDPRVIRTYPAIWESTADYVDLHTYPGFDLTLAEYVENYEINGMVEKPIVMGEFGAFRAPFPTAQDAALALVDWQVESCQYGFDGWLVWTWDREDHELYSALSDEGAINSMLAPAVRPDPCAFGEGVQRNLALGAEVRASAELSHEPAAHAVDGKASTQWGAGADPPQWIEVDLGAPAAVSELRLLVAQWPEGETVHRVSVRGATGDFVEVVRFSQVTRQDDWLVFTPDSPLTNVQVVQVETVSSPSWTAWKEIQVMGE